MTKIEPKTIEFGDFQTPENLAIQIIKIILKKTHNIQTIIEPTCGIGNILKAAVLLTDPQIKLYGWEINPEYVNIAIAKFRNIQHQILIEEKNFFEINLDDLTNLTYPILFLGNPPWVTNSKLGTINGKNLPHKTNFQKYSGFDAISGKSNFDISEWILLEIAKFISNKNAVMAFIVKTSVARKVFNFIAKYNLSISDISMYIIDSKQYFNVRVDACLFYAKGTPQNNQHNRYTCQVYSSLEASYYSQLIGYINNYLISDINTYKQLESIDSSCEFTWRSGIKHDCAKVMELEYQSGHFINGFGKIVKITDEFLYPLYKSSHISKVSLKEPSKFIIVTQKYVGDNCDYIQNISPSTWSYLAENISFFKKRKSAIYQKNHQFSIFGVGDYSFAPWKVAISGLYKNLKFSLIGTFKSKPIVLDDTCYFLAFERKDQAELVYNLLSSQLCLSFLKSIIFKDNKRPITISILNRINLKNLAIALNLLNDYQNIFN
jgi:hypothetical protein